MEADACFTCQHAIKQCKSLKCRRTEAARRAAEAKKALLGPIITAPTLPRQQRAPANGSADAAVMFGGQQPVTSGVAERGLGIAAPAFFAGQQSPHDDPGDRINSVMLHARYCTDRERNDNQGLTCITADADWQDKLFNSMSWQSCSHAGTLLLHDTADPNGLFSVICS